MYVCEQPLGASAVQKGVGGVGGVFWRIYGDRRRAGLQHSGWKGVRSGCGKTKREEENTFAWSTESENAFQAWQKKHFSEWCRSFTVKTYTRRTRTFFVSHVTGSRRKQQKKEWMVLAKSGSLICLHIKKKKNNDEKSNLQCYISRYIFQDVLKKKKNTHCSSIGL